MKQETRYVVGYGKNCVWGEAMQGPNPIYPYHTKVAAIKSCKKMGKTARIYKLVEVKP